MILAWLMLGGAALAQGVPGGTATASTAQQGVPTSVPPVTGYMLSNTYLSNAPEQNRAEIVSSQAGQEKTAPEAPELSTTSTPLPHRTEFQDFIQTSLDKELPLFGHDLFLQPPSTFAPVDRVPVTADYVVGPGDEILIRAWGQIDIDYRVTVDRNGLINLPKVGNIHVAGVQYKDLNAYLKTAIGRVFKNFELNVTLGQLRSIQVFVVGYANRPGSYTVSSLSTLINTLFASGGPSAKGSMRRIQLKRSDQVVTEFDMYDLLIKGDKSNDTRLSPGDVIYIPPVGGQVAVSGSVNMPAIYEIKNEPTLREIIAMAGGLTTTASTERMMLERISPQKTRTVHEIQLDSNGLNQGVHDGDVITVLPISPKFENAVTLRGNVATAARYPWRENMRVLDLIPSVDMLITQDYWLRKNAATRTGIKGEASLSSAVHQSIAEINWDYAVIERLDTNALTTTLIPFNLGKAILEKDMTQNLALLPGDVVTIFSKNDIRVPQAKQTVIVRLEGELVQPGVYQARPGETLRELVSRIGGFSPQAYLYGVEFSRESVRVAQQRKMEQAIDQLEQDLTRHSIAAAQNVLSTEQSQALPSEMEARKALIAKMRTVKATGRIPLELPMDATVADLPDIVLEDGDRLVVPYRPAVVSVLGAVYAENSFLFRPEKRMGDYLAQAGGMNKHADRDDAYIIRADGTVFSRQHASWHTSLESQPMMPGDTIVVPEQLDKSTWRRSLKDWTQILYQFGLGAAAISVLK